MSDIHQQMRATQKAMLRHLAQTQRRIFESLEKVAVLNLKLARAGLEEWAEKLHEATRAAHDPLGHAPALLSTDFEKVLDYGRHLNDILSEAQKNLLSLSEERIGETAHDLARSVENLMQETRDLLPVRHDPALGAAEQAEAPAKQTETPAAEQAEAPQPTRRARAKPARTAGSAPSAPKAAKPVTRKTTKAAAPRKTAAGSAPTATGKGATARAQPTLATPKTAEPGRTRSGQTEPQPTAAAKTAPAQPAPAQPAATQPAATQPAATRPTSAQLTTPQPAAILPAAVQSVPAKTTVTPAKRARMPRKAGPTAKRS